MDALKKDGELNLLKAFVPIAEAKSPSTKSNVVLDGDETQAIESTTAPVVVNLKAVDISEVAVDVEDRVPEELATFRLDELALSASDLSTAPGATGRADLSLRWEQGGQIHAGGDVTIAPLALNMAIAINKIDVRPLQPYLSEHAGLIVTQGFFNTEGRMGLSRDNGAPPVVTYSGKAGLNQFASIDRKNTNDFLKWDALLLDNIALGINPTQISIDQISLADFYARVIVDADGSVNLVSMFTDLEATPTPATDETDISAPAPKSTTQPAPIKETPPIRIAQVTLSGGDVDFSDHFIKPNYSARFQDLGGHVSGLESIAEKRADVLLEGMWGIHAR